MNEVEAIGELAQGGLTARAVEPEAGEDSGHTHESACLNCGTALVGSHCHACGQRGHQHRTLGAFFHDLLHGVLHFEGKIWRTVPLLAWNPGRLTREYIDGRRASYVSPIALFLFVIFLFFAIFSAIGSSARWAEEINVSSTVEMDQAIEASEKELANLRGRLVQEQDADDTAEINSRIADLEERLRALRAAEGGPGLDIADGEATVTGEGVKSAWQKAKENPQLLIYKLQTNAYKFAWLLIPISVPFVALTFLWRRKFGLYDHTIFTTYSITFMFALVGLATLVTYFWSGTAGFVILLYAPFHMFRQLRGTYGLRRRSALWRLVALSAFAWVAIIIFAGVMTAMSD